MVTASLYRRDLTRAGGRAGLGGQRDERLVSGLFADREGVQPVIDVRVDGGNLHVRLAGWDAFAVCWRLSWEWEVPVSKIVRVYVRPAACSDCC